MAINKFDAERFMEVFVKLDQGGKLIPYSSEYYEYVFNNIDPDIFICWKNYLAEKSDKMPEDDFYTWYDNMTLDTVSASELAQYHLPDDEVLVPIGNEEVFIHTLHKITTDWYNCCNLTSSDMAIMEYSFSDIIISVSYDILTKCDPKKAKIIKDSFDTVFALMNVALDEFNTAQGDTGMHVDYIHIVRKDDSSTRAFVNDAGKLIKTVNSRTIAVSLEDVFHPKTKKQADKAYLNRFFSIVTDSGYKGMEDPGHMNYDEFIALTKGKGTSKNKDTVTN